jgi:hypothetical protein
MEACRFSTWHDRRRDASSAASYNVAYRGIPLRTSSIFWDLHPDPLTRSIGPLHPLSCASNLSFCLILQGLKNENVQQFVEQIACRSASNLSPKRESFADPAEGRTRAGRGCARIRGDKKRVRMGATGIERVTPTMSRWFRSRIIEENQRKGERERWKRMLRAAFKKHASRLASLRDSSCVATAGFRLCPAGKKRSASRSIPSRRALAVWSDLAHIAGYGQTQTSPRRI